MTLNKLDNSDKMIVLAILEYLYQFGWKNMFIDYYY